MDVRAVERSSKSKSDERPDKWMMKSEKNNLARLQSSRGSCSRAYGAAIGSDLSYGYRRHANCLAAP